MQTVNEMFSAFRELLLPLSLLLVTFLGIIENSKKIASKPLTAFLAYIGKRLNNDLERKVDEISSRQKMQEAYYLNDFYHRHIMGEKLTLEQYELAIDMFERHLQAGANSVNKLHYEVIRAFYMTEFSQYTENNSLDY